MPIIFRFMLALATTFVCCKGVAPDTFAFLPLGGSSLAELGCILAVATVLYEIGAIAKEIRERIGRPWLWFLISLTALGVAAIIAAIVMVNLPKPIVHTYPMDKAVLIYL